MEVYSGNKAFNIFYDEIFPSGICPHGSHLSDTDEDAALII